MIFPFVFLEFLKFLISVARVGSPKLSLPASQPLRTLEFLICEQEFLIFHLFFLEFLKFLISPLRDNNNNNRLGRARHPGLGSGSVGIEVLNVGGWLTNGGIAVEAGVDFLCVTEHRLVSARARSEWKKLRSKSISSVWSPASQEFCSG